ncbi:MAG: aspartate kinase [Pedobacter sp.]|nr:MAG: aspartate kinase [Pedobacter sp.]
MKVYKFGGVSIKDAESVRNLVHILSSDKDNGPKLIVISAMATVTNKLEKLLKAFLNLEGDQAIEILTELKTSHFNCLSELISNSNHPSFDDLANSFVEIEWLLEEGPQDPPDYLYDQIVSLGEIWSTKIIATYLKETGLNSQWLDARNYIITDNNYKDANVNWEKTQSLIEQKLKPILEKQTAITQGFIGSTTENFTSTLGRDGSDYSGAIFASCLNAESLTIWKDVPGVLNADPKWFDETSKIDQLSYHDAIELTYYGANVIHPKTIKPLQNKNIPLYVKSYLNPDQLGTCINETQSVLPVPSFIFKINQVLISIFPKDFSFIIEENLSTIFSLLHRHQVKVNTMLNSAISFSISVDDSEKVDALIESLQQDFKVKYNRGLELVTIRYYNPETIARVSVDKKIILEVKSRHTCQMVMKDL